MPILATVPTIAEDKPLLNGAGAYKRRTITQRLTGLGQLPFLTLGTPVPAGARLIMARMKAATAIPLLAVGTSAAATAGQLGLALVWTTPTAITNTHTTNALAFIPAQTAFGANIPINSDSVSIWEVAAAATNDLLLAVTTYNQPNLQNTAARTFYVTPYAATTSADNAATRFQVGTSTAPTVATTGYTLGSNSSASYSVDVEIVYEMLDETPDQ